MKKSLFLFLFFPFFCFSQSIWKSTKYGYIIEIPKDFKRTTNLVGKNIDFKAENGQSSIVVVVTIIPKEYKNYSIWEMLGNLDDYTKEWEEGAKEYFDNPRVVKYGKTSITGL